MFFDHFDNVINFQIFWTGVQQMNTCQEWEKLNTMKDGKLFIFHLFTVWGKISVKYNINMKYAKNVSKALSV